MLLVPVRFCAAFFVFHRYSEEDVSKNKRFQAVIREVRALATDKVIHSLYIVMACSGVLLNPLELHPYFWAEITWNMTIRL